MLNLRRAVGAQACKSLMETFTARGPRIRRERHGRDARGTRYQRGIEINGGSGASDAFVVLGAHFRSFGGDVRRGLQPGKVDRLQQVVLAIEDAHVRSVK